MKKLFVMAAILSLTACTNAQDAERVLRQQGYADIRTTGYAWLSCGKDDKVRTGFTAIAPNGERVSGAVCGGLFFKNNTIRLD